MNKLELVRLFLTVQGKLEDLQNGKPMDLHFGRFTARMLKQGEAFTLSVQPSNLVTYPCPQCGK